MVHPRIYARGNDKSNVHPEHPYEPVEEAEVLPADALACPGTVVVESVDTDIAFVAMTRRHGTRDLTLTALQ